MKQILPLIVAVTLVLAGCVNKQNTDVQETTETRENETPGNGSHWYYFSDTGIHPIQKPSEIPARAFVPWTEAVRVSDAAIVNKVPSLLINKLGLMTSSTDDAQSALHTDSLFAKTTAGAIYNTGKANVIRLYSNSFFSGSVIPDVSGSPDGNAWLARYSSDNGTFSVALTPSDVDLPANAQCVALDRIGSMWYAAFKYEKDSKVQFSYLEFETFPERKPDSPLIDLSGIKKISSDAYRKSIAPFPFSEAPDTLKSILSGLPPSTGFNLSVYAPLSRSTQTYVRPGDGSTETKDVDGTAFVSEEKTAVLFADGTFFYKPDNTSEKTHILQLPALANGYVYTYFILTGKSLLVAWEEQRFYETGRAGLLEIPLTDEVY